MPAWKSSSFLGRSMIMNKNSQFTKIFSQAILDMKDTGTFDIMIGEKSRHMDQSYNLPDPKEKPLGYKKLAFLFVVLVSGTFTSLFVALFEYMEKPYLQEQKSSIAIEDHEINPVDDHIDEFLAGLSVDETKKTYKIIVQKLSQSQDMLRLPN